MPEVESARRRSGRDGSWFALLSEVKEGYRWLMLAPHRGCLIVQEMPQAASDLEMVLVVPLVETSVWCIGIPPEVGWFVDVYPLERLDAPQSLSVSIAIDSGGGLKPMKVTMAHFGEAARGGGEVQFVTISGAFFDVGIQATGFQLDAPMQRARMPTRFVANAVRRRHGFCVSVELSGGESASLGRVLVDDGKQKRSEDIGGFVDAEGLGEQLRITVRLNDGAVGTMEIATTDAVSLSRINVPVTSLRAPLEIRSESPLGGVLSELDDSSVIVHVPVADYLPADASVIVSQSGGRHMATNLLENVLRRVAVAIDGRAGYVSVTGGITWGASTSRKVSPSRLWQLPIGATRVHIHLSARIAGSSSSSSVSVRTFECLPGDEFDVVLSPGITTARIAGSAVTPQGIVSLLEQIVD